MLLRVKNHQRKAGEAMSKEAVIFILDVGPTMWTRSIEEGSEVMVLDKAIKCLSLIISQKVSASVSWNTK